MRTIRRLFLAALMTMVALVAAAPSPVVAQGLAVTPAAFSEAIPSAPTRPRAATLRDLLRLAQPPYSYCGACTEHEDCGSQHQCCTGDCKDGKKKCYKVDDCALAR
jgi:hypothetical protein